LERRGVRAKHRREFLDVIAVVTEGSFKQAQDIEIRMQRRFQRSHFRRAAYGSDADQLF